MQSIIVATDLSPAANNAALYAINAAKSTNEELVIFHLYKVPAHVANSRVGTLGIDEMALKMKNKIENYAAVLSSIYNVSIEVVVRMGDFLEEVEEVAKEYNSGMLVLGMPKKTFEQDLLGNTTTAAIYKLKIPILSVPEAASFKGINNILYACDLTRGVHAQVLETVKQYALIYGAKVEVLYVGDALKTMEGEDKLKKDLDGVDYLYKNVQSSSVIKAIQKEAELLNADVLIMTPHKHGFWSSILHRSKTRAMASKGKTPLLSLAY